MTLADFLLQLNPTLLSITIVALTILLSAAIFKGFEFSSNNKTLKLFGKKNNTFQTALIIEKIIEFAYEISYRKKEKKIKLQMSYTEQMIDEITSVFEKNFRSDLEDLLKEKTREDYIINLEKHPDLIMFKACMKILKHEWKNHSRTFFNDFFDKLNILSSSDIENEKEQYVFFFSKKKDEILNDYYGDNVGEYNRAISRSKVYYTLKRDEVSTSHILKEIINYSKNVSERVKIEEQEKRKELEDFLTENIL